MNLSDIKFRGKCVDDGKWVYFGLGEAGTCNGVLEIWSNDVDGALIDHSTVGQYTGMKDMNCVEIYAGDFVEFTYWWFDGDVAESTLSGEIVYIDSSMSYGLKHVKNSDWCNHTGACREVGDTDAFATWLFDEADFYVRGNIHDNPELLGGET